MATESTDTIIPDGLSLHVENTTKILLDPRETFLNPVQEFNRDLSVAAIRVWSEERNRVKEANWLRSKEKKTHSRKRLKSDNGQPTDPHGTAGPSVVSTGDVPESHQSYRPCKSVILEAFSATGLRSIRYAKEIPLVKYVIANDLSPSAVAAIKRNVELNNLDLLTEDGFSSNGGESLGKVHVHEGDACTLMYSHREEKRRVDVVDLDPYGTAAPFLDAAIQSISDGGLLCVTCTDLAVLATTNSPEKCFRNYGGVSVKAEYCHEAALRLVLQAISSVASRYGRYIEPLLSLSIDFYVRIFVRVQSSAIEVKKALTKASIYYICSSCQSYHEQPLGRVVEKVHEASGNVNHHYKIQAGPTVPEKCPECESTMHLAGPMWSAPIHDASFIEKVLEHLEAHQNNYGTAVRMKGMLTVAKEELPNPFYFTTSRVASLFHCRTPSLDDIASALLNAGCKISRSHACAGSLKTTASHREVHDIFRSWVNLNPVKMEALSETSPSRRLLEIEPRTIANFTRHPNSLTASGKVKLVRYQENPRNWGPGAKPGVKRKRGMDTD
ncbi:N2 N2-dimethylguanosine tRNA methyltransferase [Amanita rubescens]|nr:N2 N2-dimethylguanosine tRNA methyltransferase [Amanita rubescens]